MKKHLKLVYLAALLLLLVAAACSPAATAVQPAPATADPAKSFTDPFEYCLAVGTIDKPDARYTGDAVTDDIIEGYKQSAKLTDSTMPSEQWKKATIWRCMGGRVYACNFGANLPCDSKAETDKTPTQAVKDFCGTEPDAEFIPMAVTGHATVYNWRCTKGEPVIVEQIVQPDEAGFLSDIWYPVFPSK